MRYAQQRTLSILITMAMVVIFHVGAQAAELNAQSRWVLWLESIPKEDTVVSALPLSKNSTSSTDQSWQERWGKLSPAIAWNDIAIDLIIKYQKNPLRAVRALALLHVAMHDALVLCARSECSEPATRIALHAAAGRTLKHLYPQESPGRLEALSLSAAHAVMIGNALNNDLQTGWKIGHLAARAAVIRALNDGADLPRNLKARPPQKPGIWRSTPPMNIHDPAEPRAGEWRPWVLKSGAEFEPPPPVTYDSAAYWSEVEEVRLTAINLTASQKKIAEDWNLDLGTVTPAGVWNQSARRAALAQKLDIAETTRLFAALNVAMMDAFIACWHSKFKWWTQRPITAVREKYDANFLSHVLTPPFPSYVSGHSAGSGAASTVLGMFFPDQAEKFWLDAEEAAISRLYGGIHFTSDNTEGLKLGRRVGGRVIERIQQR
ncbi:MAG: vanadium-dependent haloperoxidase [Burkholderiales bacterium]|nr:vanadium-dependent haloperoxidase [Burkholderiales bacterium]